MRLLRLAAVLCAMTACSRDRDPARHDGATEGSASEATRLAALDSSLRAIDDGERAAPRDRWDPAYVVATVGRDPERLFAWVRDSTSWIPYRGALRGPVGVLMDRQGNALDRALLLATLLENAGHSVRLAHGALGRSRAAAILPALVAHQAASPATTEIAAEAPQADVRPVAARYGLDAASIGRTMERQEQVVAPFYEELNARVEEQSARLLRELRPRPADDWQGRFARAMDALRDHWWVQRKDGERWVDLDPLAALDSAGETVPATESFAARDLPSDLQHTLAIRVVAEEWAGGALTERRVLEHVLRPAELHGQPLVLRIWPGAWPAEIHSDPSSPLGLRGAALEQGEWGAVLTAGTEALAQGVIALTDAAPEPSGGGLLGGLGASIAASAKPQSGGRKREREVTAVWIEYELRDPGEAPRTIRRAAFDLIGPAARAAGAPARFVPDEAQRLTRSLGLMLNAEILPVTSRLAPEYVTHLTARALLANAGLIRSLARTDVAKLPDADTLLARAAAPVSPLFSLALARLEWSPVGDRLQVDRLGLVTQHRHPAVAGGGEGAGGFEMRGAFEVTAGELGVALSEPDAFAVRLRQGVLDTNAEALWWPGQLVQNTGEAYKGSRDWVVLTAERRSDVGGLRLPDDVRTRMGGQLDSGLVVVTPSAPVSAGPEPFVGWWAVDPVTGSTHGVMGDGRGHCQTEYGATLRAVLVQAARSFAFEYGLCQAIQQSVNGFRSAGAQLQERKMWFWWVPPIRSEDPLALFKKSNQACLINAMMAGMLSTLPILLYAERAQELTLAARRRPTLSSLDNFTPNRPVPRPKGYPSPPGAPPRRGPGGTLPGGSEPAANPFGKTEPGLPKTEPGPPKTQADPPMPPTERAPAPRPTNPLSEADARRRLQEAAAAERAAGQASNEATRDYVRYRASKPNPGRGNPGDPANYDPVVDEALANDMRQKQSQWYDAINEMKAAQRAARDAAGAARGAQGGGGFPAANPAPQSPPAPNFPGCPPNCGNNNPTGSAASSGSEIAVGSSGVASSFYPFPWQP